MLGGIKEKKAANIMICLLFATSFLIPISTEKNLTANVANNQKSTISVAVSALSNGYNKTDDTYSTFRHSAGYPPSVLVSPWDIYGKKGNWSGVGIGGFDYFVNSYNGFCSAKAQCLMTGAVTSYAEFWHGTTWTCTEDDDYGVTFIYEYGGSYETWAFIGLMDMIAIRADIYCTIENTKTHEKSHNILFFPNFFFPIFSDIPTTKVSVTLPSLSFEEGVEYRLTAKVRVSATAISFLTFPGGRIRIDGSLKKIIVGDDPPNTPPEPTGPDFGDPNKKYTYTISTIDPNGDNIRYLFDWGDGTQTWSAFVPSGVNVSKSHSWDSGTYNIRVLAEDTYGARSDWSPAKTVYMFLNQPPLDPSKPFGPTVGTVGKSYFYTTFGDDPNSEDGDRLYFLYDWGDATYSEWLGPYYPMSEVNASHVWNCTGTFEIKVKARDVHSAESGWSNPLIVRMGNIPPEKPRRPEGKTRGKFWKEYQYSSSTIDLDDHNLYYLFDWGDGTDSGWIGPYSSGAMATASHKWSTAGTFEITVKAKDSYGAESEWSDPLPVKMPKTHENLFQQLFGKLLERALQIFEIKENV